MMARSETIDVTYDYRVRLTLSREEAVALRDFLMGGHYPDYIREELNAIYTVIYNACSEKDGHQ